ncbi:hypothetical protein WJX77_004531 [Trebouxia sp. C0004]
MLIGAQCNSAAWSRQGASRRGRTVCCDTVLHKGRAQVEAMFLLKETAEMPAQQSKVRTCIKRLFQMHRTLLAKTKALPMSIARPSAQTEPAATPADKQHASAEEQQRGQLGSEDDERLLQDLVGSQQERNNTYEDLIKRALGTSAQLHKRALRLDRTCSAKDEFIAHQQAALESKDHASSDMQSTIARLTKSTTDQERIIAEQQATIAALQVHVTKLVCHEHSDKYKTHQQSSQGTLWRLSCVDGPA